jgi:hypothetical protein
MKIVFGIMFALCVAVSAFAQDPWKPFEFLIGDWVGEGGGGPGQGEGGFSLQFDLNKTVLVRKNFSEYPAQNGKPASRHDDLMIIYLDESSRKPRAIYFDSEGHTIRYAVTVRANALVFESEAGEPLPHYRLTYTPAGNRVNGKFEIRGPGDADYKTFIDFAVRRKTDRK